MPASPHLAQPWVAASATLVTVLVLIVASVLLVAVLAVLRARRRRREWGLDDEGAEAVVVEREVSAVVERLIGTPAITSTRLRLPPRADEPGRVPGPGVLHVGGVELPNGRPVRRVDTAVVELVSGTSDEADAPGSEQLWIASRAEPTAAGSFKRFAAAFAQSGLWPLLLPVDHAAELDGEWFHAPARRHGADGAAVEDCFSARLAESLDGSPLGSTDLLASSGVASGTLGRGSGRRTDALDLALAAAGDARLALAPGRRPADVLHALAWPGADEAGIPTAELAELVASWEERYGALLVSLGAHSMLLAVLAPPGTRDEAVEALAELHALCPDEAVDWGDDLRGAQQLIDAPVWTLTWH